MRGVKSHGVRSQSSKPNCRLSLQVKGGLAFFYKGSTSRAVTLCDGSDHIPHFSQGSVTTWRVPSHAVKKDYRKGILHNSSPNMWRQSQGDHHCGHYFIVDLGACSRNSNTFYMKEVDHEGIHCCAQHVKLEELQPRRRLPCILWPPCSSGGGGWMQPGSLGGLSWGQGTARLIPRPTPGEESIRAWCLASWLVWKSPSWCGDPHDRFQGLEHF